MRPSQARFFGLYGGLATGTTLFILFGFRAKTMGGSNGGGDWGQQRYRSFDGGGAGRRWHEGRGSGQGESTYRSMLPL